MKGLVSVLLPCYNAERSVAEAVESVLCQTYQDLEILALDDGSTDSTTAILQAFVTRDPRVTLVRSEVHQGLISALNRGVSVARGEFIARMDADDIAAPERLARQVAVLRALPEISLVGTGVRLITANQGRPLRPRPVRCYTPDGARFAALVTTPTNHVTIMARAELMRAHQYGGSEHSLHTEDYELWARMLSAGAGFANLEEKLMTVRVDPRGVSLTYEQTQIENFVRSAYAHLVRTTGLHPGPGAHRVLVNRMDLTVTSVDLHAGLRLLEDLERSALAHDPSASVDIHRVADLQRVDILVQAALKGSAGVRKTAVGLAAQHVRLLRSASARAYLASKLRAPQRASGRPGRR